VTVTTQLPSDTDAARYHYKTSIVVGGLLSQKKRRSVREGAAPRIDVLELESRLGARVYDLSALESPGRGGLQSWMARQIAGRTGRKTQTLAYEVLDAIRDDDVVYATGEDVGYFLALMMRMFRVNKPALVVRLDQATLGKTFLKRLAGSAYIDAALKRIDRIGCHSIVQLQYLNSVRRVPFENLCLLPPKVDSSFFDPEITDEAEPGLVPERPYVLSGGLEERDYGTLIEAAAGLPVDVVIGAASPWSHHKFGHPETMPDNVRVGVYSHLQMRQLYRGARFVVVPLQPTMRTCGVTVILESWSMRKAVIATRTIGQLAYTHEGKDVRLVPPRDVSAMRGAIRDLLDRPDEAARLGAAGRQRIDDEYHLERFLDLSVKVFTEAADSRRHRLG
jgi:glycosyltransferase involved in cell wall biosynthesis